MKTRLLFKFLVILPLFVFIDYLFMAILGCTGCLMGFGENFTCNVYCYIGKIILCLSGVFFIYLIFRDIKKYHQKTQYGTTGEKQESL